MKKSIHQVAVEVLQAAGTPMSAAEIYAVINEKNLYEFKAKNPEGVLRSQLRRHTRNIAVANRVKESVFTLDDDGRFAIAQG